MTTGDDRAAEQAFRQSVHLTPALSMAATITLADTLALLGGVLPNRGQYAEVAPALRELVWLRQA